MGRPIPSYVTEEDVKLQDKLSALKAQTRTYDEPMWPDARQPVSLNKVDAYADCIIRYLRQRWRMDERRAMALTLGSCAPYKVLTDLQERLECKLRESLTGRVTIHVLSEQKRNYDYDCRGASATGGDWEAVVRINFYD